MVFDYFAFARAKKNQAALEKTNPQNPVLNREDEQFLEKVASHDAPAAPLPPPTIVTKDDGGAATTDTAAGEVALPDPTAAEASSLAAAELPAAPQKRTWASYVPAAPSMPSMPSIPSMPSMPSMPTWRSKTSGKEQPKPDSAGTGATDVTEATTDQDQSKTESGEAAAVAATDASAPDATTEKVDEKLDAKDASEQSDQPAAYPPGIKVTEDVKLDQAKKDQDEKEVSVLLDRLNLSSINNRVFSFSKESQKIYEDFTIVLKDMINGAPTAYQDMEKLMKDNDAQLREMFKNMPPFVQTLVKSLPAKLGTTLGPEVLAAASEKPGADMKARMQAASSPPPPAGTKSKQRKNVPSVKGLANEKGAVAGMLRSTVAFLKSRFPAFVTGTNVIMSIAVFVLLFVFWYCHKRGRETRLQHQADAASITEAEDADSIDESQILTPDEKDGEEEEDEEGEEEEEEEDEQPSADEIAKSTGGGASAKTMQDILNQPAPAEVPLPEDDGLKESKATATST